VKVLLDLSQDEELKKLGACREVCNKIQRLRQKAGLLPEDNIVIFVSFCKTNAPKLKEVYENHRDLILGKVKKPFYHLENVPAFYYTVARQSYEQDGEKLEVVICENRFALNEPKVNAKYEGMVPAIGEYLSCMKPSAIAQQLNAKNSVSFKINTIEVTLVKGEDLFASWAEYKE
jgi:hypothetical protein